MLWERMLSVLVSKPAESVPPLCGEENVEAGVRDAIRCQAERPLTPITNDFDVDIFVLKPKTDVPEPGVATVRICDGEPCLQEPLEGVQHIGASPVDNELGYVIHAVAMLAPGIRWAE